LEGDRPAWPNPTIPPKSLRTGSPQFDRRRAWDGPAWGNWTIPSATFVSAPCAFAALLAEIHGCRKRSLPYVRCPRFERRTEAWRQASIGLPARLLAEIVRAPRQTCSLSRKNGGGNAGYRVSREENDDSHPLSGKWAGVKWKIRRGKWATAQCVWRCRRARARFLVGRAVLAKYLAKGLVRYAPSWTLRVRLPSPAPFSITYMPSLTSAFGSYCCAPAVTNSPACGFFRVSKCVQPTCGIMGSYSRSYAANPR
jgi:hypothetical protein